MKRIVGFLMILCCLIGMLSGCGGDGELVVENAVEFVSSAAEKTEGVHSVRMDVTGMIKQSDTLCMAKREYVIVRSENGVLCQTKSGMQKQGETSIVMECKQSDSIPAMFSYPITVAQHQDLSHYLKADTKPIADGDGLYHFEYMMTHGDLNYIMTGELCCSNVDGSDINKPVAVRLYVNEDGYFCGMEYDMAVAPDGSGEIYTNSFRYSQFDTATFEESLSESLTVESTLLAPVKTALDKAQLASIYDKRTVDKVLSYEGRLSGAGYYSNGVRVALKSDGTLFVKAHSSREEFAERLISLQEDFVSVGSYDYDIVVGVKKDGSVKLYSTYENDAKELGWDLSAFTNIKFVDSGDGTLYGLKQNGDVVATGRNAAAVYGWKNVKQLSVYDQNVIALKNDGSVYVAGEFDVMDAAGWNDLVSVSAGRFHVVGLKTGGTVVTAGTNPLENSYGEQEVSTWADIVGISAGNMSTVGIRSDGSVVAVGFEVDYMNKWTDVVYVDADMRWGIRYNGTVYDGEDDWDLF
ncbi:MAG: hypothetical protein IJC46_01030 [Clostridia bacterium]|nr:hypothetical protein [Clostridia bacterium]